MATKNAEALALRSCIFTIPCYYYNTFYFTIFTIFTEFYFQAPRCRSA